MQYFSRFQAFKDESYPYLKQQYFVTQPNSSEVTKFFIASMQSPASSNLFPLTPSHKQPTNR